MSSGSRTFIELARRRQIVEAAIETISDVGLSRASIAAIASRASVSPALISYHFGSRQGLVDAVLATIQAGVDAAMEATEEDESYPAALEGMLRRFALHCLDHLPAMMVLTQFRQRDGVGAEQAEEGRAAGLSELVGFIEEGQRYGQFRQIDTPMCAAIILNAMSDLPYEMHRRTVADRAHFVQEWPLLFVRAISSDDGAIATGEDTP